MVSADAEKSLAFGVHQHCGCNHYRQARTAELKAVKLVIGEAGEEKKSLGVASEL